jgi:NAD(P)H-hydrate epimerase
VIPIVTPEEMRAIDAAAPEPTSALIERAGAAVARLAVDMLGGTYGRRVVVVAGKGNNGADGRAAAKVLERRGVRVTVIAAADAPPRLPASDLVIDAAYGTGFHGTYNAPDPSGAPVLAVDIPSGVDGLTGEATAGAVDADVVVTFAALKPGLLGLESPVVVADIGLNVSAATAHLVEDDDVRETMPSRPRDAHKYWAAVLAIAGSPGMLGAPRLVADAALHAGSGYVRLLIPGGDLGAFPIAEVVTGSLPSTGWAVEALEKVERMAAVVVGPGIGRDETTVESVGPFLVNSNLPAVVDADALFALATFAPTVVAMRKAPMVLTPHDGEFARLTGAPPANDRLGAVRAAATRWNATVLLKGRVTIVADPDGRALVAATGGPELATAGTGDVLSGVIAALLAQGLAPLEAAALGAHVHGASARRGHAVGLVAGDLPALIADWLSDVLGANNHG